MKRKEELTFESPFEVIEENQDIAKEYQFRADLMLHIRDIVEERKIQQKELCQILSITQPRASDLMNGKFRKFSVESLLGYLKKLGYGAKFLLTKSSTTGVLEVSREESETTAQTALGNTLVFA